ncbi:MAG: hypothetical protein AB2A00_42035, partial [Myxococcota bacterium]
PPPPPPAPVARPAAPTRPVARPLMPTTRAELGADGEPVSHEMRRKAEKIFEQAEKDFASGNLSSARMNAKLATIYDPGNPVYKEALEKYDRAAKDGSAKPKNRPRELVLFEEAQTAEGRGEFEMAVKLLEKAISINDEVGPIHNRLGVVLAIHLKEYERAVTCIQRAIELDPNNLSYKNNLGKVLAMQQAKLDREPKKKSFFKESENEVIIKARKFRPKEF